ncbi:MAG: hypothetical protein ACYTF6_14725, partial [Planctomycetota bacterium]
DLFYIKGQGNPGKGSRREYFFHTTKHHVQTARTSLPMEKLPGERGMLELEGQKWSEKMIDGRGYGVFFDAREGNASRTFTVDFEVPDPWKPLMWRFDPKRGSEPVEIKGKTPNSALPYKALDDSWAHRPAIGIRRHIVGFAGQKAYMYEFPHPAKLHANKNSDGWGRMPGFLLRHDVEDTAEATEFVVVHEAWTDKPYITSVERLPKENGSANAIALLITMPGRTDTVVLSNDEHEATYSGAGIRFKGRFGIVVKAGGKADAALIGGTRLAARAAGIDYALPTGAYVGTVTESERAWRGREDGLYVDAKLPQSLAGSWMMVNVKGTSIRRNEKAENLGKVISAGWAFRIAAIERKNGRTFVRTEEEHGLEIKDGSCREFFKPHNHIKGPTQFQIHPYISNQSLVQVSPAGGPQAGPVRVRMKPLSAIAGAKVEYLIVPLDAPDVYSVDDKTLQWRIYAVPVTIDSDCRLLVRAVAAGGIKVPVAQRYEFTMPPTPTPVADPGTLKPLPIYVRRYYKKSGTNIEEPQVRMFYKQKGENDYGRHISGIGLLKIAEAGAYTFHYHGQREGKLVLGGRTLFDGNEPSGEAAECHLEPGYYAFGFVCKGSITFDFEWRGPGLKRRAFKAGDLFHRQATLDKYQNEFRTQPKLR